MSLSVHVWSDIACPWCFVGKRRFEEAARRCAVAAEVTYHSFELDPRPLASGDDRDYTQRLADKFGASRDYAQRMFERLAATGKEDGIEFRFEEAVWANTFDAHRMLHWAKSFSNQSVLLDTLCVAHFQQGRDLNSSDELCRIASDAKMDADRARRVLSSDEYADAVRKDESEARRLGVSGVPFFVVGQLSVGGAQQIETFERVIEKALQQEEGGEGVGGTSGSASSTCGITDR